MDHISGIVGWLIIIVIIAWMFLGKGRSQPANPIDHTDSATRNLRERFRNLLGRSDKTTIREFINRRNAGLFTACLCSYIREEYMPLSYQLHYEDITKFVRHLFAEHEVNQLLKAAHNENFLHYERGIIYLHEADLSNLLNQLFS